MLDVSFRLLKEDAIRPLREGQEIMSNKDQLNLNQKQLRKVIRESGVRLFDDVQIIDLKLSSESSKALIRLRIYEGRYVQNWKVSKKLLPGSLISISSDGFKNIHIGLVALRDAD